MNYVISDIHNDSRRFKDMLKKIDLKADDHIYVLGDIFDRCNYDPDPVGVYFTILELGDRCTLIQGNHDVWVAEYILKYLNTSKWQRRKLEPYYYNSFELIMDRLTPVDAKDLAEFILSKPMQQEITVNDTDYLLAHAMTSLPDREETRAYYLMGASRMDDLFYSKGWEGYVSICGHTNTGFFSRYGGTYSDASFQSIWKNDEKNVIMIDCGCGYADGYLGCLCLETGEEFYCSN